jgi:hypothetical protein
MIFSPKVVLIALLALVNNFFVQSWFTATRFDRQITAYSNQEANLALYVAGATYCDLPHLFTGVLSGLNITLNIFDDHYKTSGFVATLPSANTIYVAYRGSSNWQNWMANLETSMTPYTSFPTGECSGNCQVHRGFYTALLADFDAVTTEVRRLQSEYPTYKVKTTGHSLGAALAQLAAMELTARGVRVTNTYNFGQPRTGNKYFSAFANTLMTTYRHVHYADPVPHVPPPQFGFVHECTEMYEPNEVYNGTIQSCGSISTSEPYGNSCEAEGKCMLSWNDTQLNPDDHMIYLGIYIKCY